MNTTGKFLSVLAPFLIILQMSCLVLLWKYDVLISNSIFGSTMLFLVLSFPVELWVATKMSSYNAIAGNLGLERLGKCIFWTEFLMMFGSIVMGVVSAFFVVAQI